MNEPPVSVGNMAANISLGYMGLLKYNSVTKVLSLVETDFHSTTIKQYYRGRKIHDFTNLIAIHYKNTVNYMIRFVQLDVSSE